MFKKTYEAICEEMIDLRKFIHNNFSQQSKDHFNTRSMINDASRNIMSKIDKTSNIIASQQRTIEQLTNALMDKYEHGLFVFSEDGKIPMVIRNGKELTNEMTSYCSVEWNYGECPHITLEQNGVTFYDTEV